MLRVARVIVALSVLLAACGRSSSPASIGFISPVPQPGPEPAVVAELRANWESHADRHKGKTEYGKAGSDLHIAFDKAVEAGGLDEILQYVERSIAHGREQEILTALHGQLVFGLMHRADRARLVELLSHASADISSYWSIEQMLTLPAEWNRIPDGLAVLCDAYDNAKTESAREAHYVAMWRALGDLPGKEPDHSAYMRNARAWYVANVQRLERSKQYDYNDLDMWRMGSLSGERPPHLFTVK